MERNIDEFLENPDQQQEMEALTEEQFYEKLEEDLYEAMMQIMTPFQNNVNVKKDEKLTPLTRNKSSREYAYGGKASTVVKRQDKVKLAKNKDLKVAKTAIRAAFKAIIAASNKTKLGSQITNTLRTTEKRLFQQIDKKIELEKKNAPK